VNEVSGNKPNVRIAVPLVVERKSRISNRNSQCCRRSKEKTILNQHGKGRRVERVVHNEFPLDVKHFENR